MLKNPGVEISPTMQAQSELMNRSHGIDAFISGSGLGVDACLILRWKGYLGEYDIEPLAYPVLVVSCGGRARIRRMIDNHQLSEDYAMAGDITLIPRGQAMRWNVNREVDVIAVIFENAKTCDLLQNLYDRIIHKSDANAFVGSFTNEYIFTTCSHLTNILSGDESVNQDYLNTHLRALELYLLNYLGRKNDGLQPLNTPYSQHVHYTIERLELGFRNKIQIDDIARELGLSPEYLSRIFKVEVGTTPHRLLLARRIRHAKSLLANTEVDISTIAYESGFSSQSHLTRLFTREVGMSPLKFRKHTQKERS